LRSLRCCLLGLSGFVGKGVSLLGLVVGQLRCCRHVRDSLPCRSLNRGRWRWAAQSAGDGGAWLDNLARLHVDDGPLTQATLGADAGPLLGFGVGDSLESGQCLRPEPLPVLTNLADALWIDRVDAARADLRIRHQAGHLQDAQVLAHRRTAHRQPGGQLANRCRTLEQTLENRPSRTVAHRVQCRCVSIHLR